MWQSVPQRLCSFPKGTAPVPSYRHKESQHQCRLELPRVCKILYRKGTCTWRYVFISIILKGRGYIFFIMKTYVTAGACNKGHVYCEYLKSNSHSGIKKDRKKRRINRDNETVRETEIWISSSMKKIFCSFNTNSFVLTGRPEFTFKRKGSTKHHRYFRWRNQS